MRVRIFVTSLLVVAGLLAVACGDDDDSRPGPTSTAAPASESATGTEQATATTTASSTPVATATFAAPKGLTGLFHEPRTTAIKKVTPPAAPPLGFAEWDGSAVIYDVVAGKETNLGPGSAPVFSPDGRLAAWSTGDGFAFTDREVKVIDLATGSVRAIAPGRAPHWLDDDTVAYFLPGTENKLAALNLTTGITTDVTDQRTPNVYIDRLVAARETTPDGFRVTSVFASDATPLARGGQSWKDVKVTSVATGQVVLAFKAFEAAPAGKGHIVVAASPAGTTVNLFLVAIATGQAEFIATARASEPNFPLVGDDARIAWVDDFCGQPPGNLTVYDRGEKTVTEVEGVSDYVRLTPDGRLGLGAFGARRLMDPVSFQTVARIPTGSDVNWSPDYRYASHGWTGGHGGLC